MQKTLLDFFEIDVEEDKSDSNENKYISLVIGLGFSRSKLNNETIKN